MRRNILFYLLIFLFTFSCAVFAQAEQQLPLPVPKIRSDLKLRQLGQLAKEKEAGEFTGRLGYHDWGKDKRLIFHGQDGLGYIIEGDMTEKLKDVLFQLGENNLVCLKAYKAKGHTIHCRHSYDFDAKGNRKEDTVCLKYGSLEVFEIISQALSDQELPPLPRDSEAEAEARSRNSHEQFSLTGGQKSVLSQYKGTIKKVNLKSPIKSVVIVPDASSARAEEITLLLTANTRVAKRLSKDKGLALDAYSLKKGQKVLVIYSHDDFNGEALNVTVIDD